MFVSIFHDLFKGLTLKLKNLKENALKKHLCQSPKTSLETDCQGVRGQGGGTLIMAWQVVHSRFKGLPK